MGYKIKGYQDSLEKDGTHQARQEYILRRQLNSLSACVLNLWMVNSLLLYLPLLGGLDEREQRIVSWWYLLMAKIVEYE